MPLPALAVLALLAAARSAPAPHAPSLRELGPFLLGQYETAARAKLGEPKRETKDDDSDRLLIYSLAGDMETYLVLTVRGEEYPEIAAIQLTGRPLPGVRGLGPANLGDAKEAVLRAFGEPSELSPMDEEGAEFAEYGDRNYSFEFDGGRLTSIKIVASDVGFPEKEESEPDLKEFARALAARDREAILDLLCADLEIYTEADETVEFRSGAREELMDEESLAARYLYGGAGSVRELLTPALAATPKGEREGWSDGARPVHVFSKTGPLYEIVWNFEAGRWRVWEIALTPPDEDDPTRRAGRRAARLRSAAPDGVE